MSDKSSAVREHMRKAYEARRKQMKHLMPEEFWQEGRKAKREMLLAFRSMVDEMIDHLESDNKGHSHHHRQGEKMAKPGVESAE